MYTHEFVPPRSNKVGKDMGVDKVARSSGAFIVFDVPEDFKSS
jgi:hypothetical protein